MKFKQQILYLYIYLETNIMSLDTFKDKYQITLSKLIIYHTNMFTTTYLNRDIVPKSIYIYIYIYLPITLNKSLVVL
jgi:hypothetical protein